MLWSASGAGAAACPSAIKAIQRGDVASHRDGLAGLPRVRGPDQQPRTPSLPDQVKNGRAKMHPVREGGRRTTDDGGSEPIAATAAGERPGRPRVSSGHGRPSSYNFQRFLISTQTATSQPSAVEGGPDCPAMAGPSVVRTTLSGPAGLPPQKVWRTLRGTRPEPSRRGPSHLIQRRFGCRAQPSALPSAYTMSPSVADEAPPSSSFGVRAVGLQGQRRHSAVRGHGGQPGMLAAGRAAPADSMVPGDGQAGPCRPSGSSTADQSRVRLDGAGVPLQAENTSRVTRTMIIRTRRAISAASLDCATFPLVCKSFSSAPHDVGSL